MKRLIVILACCTAVMAFAAPKNAKGKKAKAKPKPFTSEELRTVAKTAPDKKIAWRLFAVSKTVDGDKGLEQSYLKASAAALIAAGESKVYFKNVKASISDAEAFESTLTDACPKCSGSGEGQPVCPPQSSSRMKRCWMMY